MMMKSTIRVSLLLLLLLLLNMTMTRAFHQSTMPPSRATATRQRNHYYTKPNNRRSSSSSSSTSLQAMEILDGPAALFDDFFRTQPFLSAFMMCSFKASAADLLAQTSASTSDSEETKEEIVVNNDAHYSPLQNWFRSQQEQQRQKALETAAAAEDDESMISLHRNVAFLLYGGLYQGMFLQFLYMVVYPFLYGDSLFRIPLCIGTDILCFGPFVTLPIAYIIKAIVEHATTESSPSTTTTSTTSSSMNEAIEMAIHKYKNHVVSQDLLLKYWALWAPAQTFNWLFVPEHLRVFFVAFVSFFWVFLLSMISSNQQEETTATAAAVVVPARQAS